MITGAPDTTIEHTTGEPPALQWWDHQRRWFDDHSRPPVRLDWTRFSVPTGLGSRDGLLPSPVSTMTAGLFNVSRSYMPQPLPQSPMTHSSSTSQHASSATHGG